MKRPSFSNRSRIKHRCVRVGTGARVIAAVVALCCLSSAVAQNVAMIAVFKDRYEFDGRVFRTIDELRPAVHGMQIGIETRECGVEEQLAKIATLVRERRQMHLIQSRPADLKCDADGGP